MGSRADSYGDESRANSLYAKQQETTLGDSAAAADAKLAALKAAAKKLDAKLAPAVEKKQNPVILDALNAEMYNFKQLLSATTKLRQGGKVCLVDASQRGATMPRGFDPDDCPLQLVQVAILQDVNDLTRAAQTRDSAAVGKAYSALNKDLATFYTSASS